MVSELSTVVLPPVDVIVVLLLVDKAFVDGDEVAMFRFWLLIEDSRMSLASIAWSRNKEAPSCPPNYNEQFLIHLISNVYMNCCAIQNRIGVLYLLHICLLFPKKAVSRPI